MSRRKNLDRKIGKLLKEDVLDEQEQQEIVESFRQMQASQEMTWRVAFGVLSLVLSGILFFDSWQQWAKPWERKHHYLWQGCIGPKPLAFCESLQALALLGCALQLKPRLLSGAKPVWVMTSVTTCAIVGLTMLLAFINSKEGTGWLRMDVLWLPVLPSLYCLMIWSVHVGLKGTTQEVQSLQKKMYSFKKL